MTIEAHKLSCVYKTWGADSLRHFLSTHLQLQGRSGAKSSSCDWTVQVSDLIQDKSADGLSKSRTTESKCFQKLWRTQTKMEPNQYYKRYTHRWRCQSHQNFCTVDIQLLWHNILPGLTTGHHSWRTNHDLWVNIGVTKPYLSRQLSLTGRPDRECQ